MNRFFTLLLTLTVLFFSCKKETNNSASTYSLQTFKINDSSIRAIKAVNENTLIFADSKGRIGKTIDGGKTWQYTKVIYNDSVSPHFRSIAINKDTIFALSIANPALLYKVYNEKSDIVYKEEHANVFYDALSFFPDNKHGIAIGDPTEDCPSIIVTKDGGNTWCKIACSDLPKFEKGEAFFAASNTNIKIINNTAWIVSGGKKARVLKSTDMGVSWEVYPTPIVQGKESQGIYSVDFYDELNGVMVGGDYTKPEDNCANKATTTDGGRTWKLIADNQEPNYKSCVQYIPNSNAAKMIAVGKTGISISRNNGLNWKKISDDDFYAIQFITPTTAWLSGNGKVGKLTLK